MSRFKAELDDANIFDEYEVPGIETNIEDLLRV